MALAQDGPEACGQQPAQVDVEASTTPTAQLKPHRHLHGRDFYNSIGAPRYILAPMVDHSHLAWRILVRRHAPAPPPHPASSGSANLPGFPVPPFMAYTPMFHSRNFTQSNGYIQQNFPSASPKDAYGLDGHPEVDRPLVVQFCSNVPADLLRGCQAVRGYTDAVDLNLGCPQGIAKKGHYGAFLQEEWGLVHDLLSTSAKAREEEEVEEDDVEEKQKVTKSSDHSPKPLTTTTPTTSLLPPITAKIRILDSPEKTLEYANMVLSSDVTWLCVHGRTRDQKGHNTGLASWPRIAHLRTSLPPRTVLIANGNLLWPGDAARCLASTGADAVMSAEGALFNPTGIFLDPETATPNTLFPRMDVVAREYLQILRDHVLEYIPPPALHPTNPQPPSLSAPVLDPNLGPVKSHLFKLLHCFLPRHTSIRGMLAKARPYVKGNRDGVDPLRDFVGVVEEVARVIEGELAANPEKVDGGGEWVGPVRRRVVGEDGAETGGWEWLDVPYYRCQPNVRVLPEEAVRRGAMASIPGQKAEEAGEGEGGDKKSKKAGKRKRGENDVGGDGVAPRGPATTTQNEVPEIEVEMKDPEGQTGEAEALLRDNVVSESEKVSAVPRDGDGTAAGTGTTSTSTSSKPCEDCY